MEQRWATSLRNIPQYHFCLSFSLCLAWLLHNFHSMLSSHPHREFFFLFFPVSFHALDMDAWMQHRIPNRWSNLLCERVQPKVFNSKRRWHAMNIFLHLQQERLDKCTVLTRHWATIKMWKRRCVWEREMLDHAKEYLNINRKRSYNNILAQTNPRNAREPHFA